ncbi:MAG TPA: hypothetical protein DEH78_23005 [Solibacterales bacterium]|nr:hypothetical protein [Bryobacterales bacterium]
MRRRIRVFACAFVQLILGVSAVRAEHVVVRLTQPLTAERRAQWEARGVRLLEPLGGGEYSAVLAPGKDRQAFAGDAGLALRALGDEEKLSPALKLGQIPGHATMDEGGVTMVDVKVRYHPDVTPQAAAAAVTANGGSIIRTAEFFSRLTARLPVDRLRPLAKDDRIAFIDTVAGPPRVHTNARSAEMLRASEVHSQPLNVLGEGIRIGIWDGGMVGSHPQFDDRVMLLQRSSSSTHATHVAGTMVASGQGDARLRGIAPRARLFSYDFYDDVPNEMLQAVRDNNVVISQNSWGLGIDEDFGNCSDYGRYGIDEREMDQLVAEANLSIVFSMGNDRDYDGCVIGARGGFYTAGRPASAKNVITVGAVDTESATSSFSGFGPTTDGRLKPDVVALGVQVRSTTPNGNSTTLSGTSMSAPAVSGLLALLHERSRGTPIGTPKPSLLKAILLNTAKDLGNPGPDYTFGYGLPDAVAAMAAIDDKRFVEGSVGQAKQEHKIEVPGNAETLRVMLVWTDPQGPASGRTPLVNDLDLAAIAPDGARTLPLTLDPMNPKADARPAVNRRDNVEQIVVRGPAAGSWTMEVRAETLGTENQSYALVWSFDRVDTPACTTTITPSLLEMREAATSAVVAVTRSNQCSAVTPTSDAGWLAVDSKESQGSSVLKLKAEANNSGALRRGTVTIGDKTVRVVQTPSCKTAEITAGERISSSLEPSDCYYADSFSYAKLFTFEAKAGQVVSIEMDSPAIDTLVGLLGPTGLVVAANDDSGESTDSRIPPNEGTIQLPVTGRYTIVATTFYDDETGPFRLRLTLADPPAVDGASPQVISLDGCPASRDGELGSRSSRSGRRGTLHYSDALEFPGRIGQNVVIDIPEASFDTFLYLVGANGSVLASNDDKAGSSLSQIEFTLRYTGRYRIEVSSFAPFVGGRYRLTVNGCTAPAGAAP